MTGEETVLSRIISPIIKEYNLVDIGLVFSLLISIAGIFVPIHPIYGFIIAISIFIYLHISNFYKDTSPTKNGVHLTVEAGDSTVCDWCDSVTPKKIGYRVVYILGYEIFRIEDFQHSICKTCSEESNDEMQGSQMTEMISNLSRE